MVSFLQRRRAFTLIELLVVVAIIALLLAIIMPALHIVKLKAKMIICGTNQRQLIYGLTAYIQNNDQTFPYHPTMDNRAGARRHRPFELNFHQPTSNDGIVRMVNPAALNDPDAYPYLGRFLGPYIPDSGVFNCPVTKFTNDMAYPPSDSGQIPLGTYSDFYLNGTVAPLHCTYGLLWRYPSNKNMFGYWEFQGPTKSSDSTKLVLMDAFFWSRPGQPNIVFQWGQENRWWSTHIFKEAEPGIPYYTVVATEAQYPEVKLNAGYIDGHVSSFNTKDSKPVGYVNVRSRLPLHWQ